MRKIISVILCITILGVSLCGCAKKEGVKQSKGGSKKYNIAVISSGSSDEEFENFIYGVSDSFRNIGYSVDKFIAEGDESYLHRLFEDVLKGGYVGVILYDLNEYANEFAPKAKEAGVFVSVFSREPYENENASTVCYDQMQMTKISVDEVAKMYSGDTGANKVCVKAWYDNNDAANAEKGKTFDEYARQKYLPTPIEIYEGNIDSGLSRTSKSKLDALPSDGNIYIWVVDDTMAALVSEYLKTQSINNAKVVSVGLVQKNVGAMYEFKNYWKATSVVNFSTAGKVCAEALSRDIENREYQKVTYIPTFILLSEELEENSTIEIIEELNRQ